jgi:sec-independent protein translocase protein TatA
MPDLGAPELIIIAVVVLVLFGSKRLPDAARSLGRSLRIFKSEVKAMGDEASASPDQTASATAVSTTTIDTLPVAAPTTSTPTTSALGMNAATIDALPAGRAAPVTDAASSAAVADKTPASAN